MKTVCTMLLALALAAPALAQEQGHTTSRAYKFGHGEVTAPGSSRTNAYNLLEDAALNGAPATLTVTIALGDANNPAKYSTMKVAWYYTFASATDARLTHHCSFDNGTSFAQVSSRKVDLGVSTVNGFVDVVDDGADFSFFVVVDVKGCSHYRVVASGTGAAAGDKVDVQATAIVGE